MERHQLSFWEARLVQAAREAGAETMWTEDLQDGSELYGVQIRNPFALMSLGGATHPRMASRDTWGSRLEDNGGRADGAGRTRGPALGVIDAPVLRCYADSVLDNFIACLLS